MAAWTLEDVGAASTQSLEAWGIIAPRLSFRNQSPDALTFSIAQATDGTETFSYRDEIILYKDGSPYFRGVVSQVPRRANEGDELLEYVVSGPWWELERLIFQESWPGVGDATGTHTSIDFFEGGASNDYIERIGGGSWIDDGFQVGMQIVIANAEAPANDGTYTLTAVTAMRLTFDAADDIDTATIDDTTATVTATAQPVTSQIAKVLLGVNSAGAIITTGAQIQTVIDFAVTAGLNLQSGTVLTGHSVWVTETRDQSCADLIRAVLKHHPSSSVSFDYSTSPPTINVLTPSAMSAVGIAVTDADSTWQATSREDQLPSSVTIVFERTHTTDSQSRVERIRKTYPAASDPTDLNAIVATIPLRGSAVTMQRQRIKTETIPLSGVDSNDTTAKEWWKDRIPEIAGIANSLLRITSHVIQFADIGEDPDPAIPGEEVVKTTDPDDYPRELIDGSIEDWMGYRSARLLVTAEILAHNSQIDDLTDKEWSFFTGPSKVFSGTAYPTGYAQYEVTGTNASTGIKSRMTSFTPQEAVPAGVAQAYYEALLELGWEGSISKTDAEPDSQYRPGKKLNITGSSLAALSTMAQPIQETEEDLELGRVRIVFGPPEHLSVQDFFESARISRQQTISSFADREETGETGIVAGGYGHPRSNVMNRGPKELRDWYGFAAFPVGNDVVKLTKGYLHVDGLALWECDPGAERTFASGADDTLWVILNTDTAGSYTSHTTTWHATSAAPSGFQKHREAQTDSETDTGQTGKYGWPIMRVVNTSGVISITPYCHAVFYYSDRSKKNWGEGSAAKSVQATVQGSTAGPQLADFGGSAGSALGLYHDTSTGNVFWVYNRNGVLKTVEMT